MATCDVRFGVLGPLEMSVGGAAIPLGSPKQRAVLAVLVIKRNSSVGIDALVDSVWGEAPPARARAILQTYISNLRRLLTDAGVDSQRILARAAPGYRLHANDDQCDLGHFAAEKSAGLRASAAGHFEQASGHLSAALGQWRGPALDDLSEFSFFNAYTNALAEDRLVVQTAYAEAEIACGRASSMIGELEALLGTERHHEPLWAQLITAYYLCGRQSDALGAYGRLKGTLSDELGIDPSPALRSLHEKILRQEPFDIQAATQLHAEDTLASLGSNTIASADSAVAALRDAQGRLHWLGTATRIGRSPDNDIVLPNAQVSRKHAVIINTGTSFVITDLQSVNGVFVGGKRIGTSAPICEGDLIQVAGHEFNLEVRHRPASEAGRQTLCEK